MCAVRCLCAACATESRLHRHTHAMYKGVKTTRAVMLEGGVDKRFHLEIGGFISCALEVDERHPPREVSRQPSACFMHTLVLAVFWQ